MTDLSVITVTHNNGNSLKSYLSSLRKYLPQNSEVIIVDSASQDKTTEMIKEDGLFKKGTLKLIEKNENIGYGKGSNLAVDQSNGEYLLLLNPDTEILNDAINKLLNFARANSFGIVAPKLVEPSGKPQPSVRNLPTVWGAIKEYLFGVRYAYSPFAPKNQEEVESVVGAAMFLKKDLFKKVGGFDERYFMYFEDLDLCSKVRQEDKKICYFPGAVIKHQVGGSQEERKKEWIRQAQKTYHGSLRVYLIDWIGRIGNKLRR
jgi:GT2 family glycosyltransferase